MFLGLSFTKRGLTGAQIWFRDLDPLIEIEIDSEYASTLAILTGDKWLVSMTGMPFQSSSSESPIFSSLKLFSFSKFQLIDL
jgi:hypothetical protein